MQQQEITWRELLTGYHSKDVWNRTFRVVYPNWNYEERLATFQTARQLAIDVGFVSLSDQPNLLINPPSQVELDSWKQSIDRGSLSAENKLLLFPRPDYVYAPGSYKSRLILKTSHHEVELIPAYVRDLTTLHQWFAYELPFGGAYSGYTFFDDRGHVLTAFDHQIKRVKCFDATEVLLNNLLHSGLLTIQTLVLTLLFLLKDYLPAPAILPAAGFTLCCTWVLTISRHVLMHNAFKAWHVSWILLDIFGKIFAYYALTHGNTLYYIGPIAAAVATALTPFIFSLLPRMYRTWHRKQRLSKKKFQSVPNYGTVPVNN